jgi:hypothetical protein
MPKIQERITIMKNKLLTFAGALALLAVLGHFYAKPLLAQVRAALVQNVDEPGRNPFALSGGDQAVWTVPAGKRYVIEEFGAECTLDPGSALTDVDVIAFNTMTITGQAFAQPFRSFVNVNFSDWVASGTTRLYVDPGANIKFFAGSNGTAPHQCFLTVSGYAINLP